MIDDYGSRTVRYLAIALAVGAAVMLGIAWALDML